jgi:4-hydroxybenzoate polyprenyltransferase
MSTVLCAVGYLILVLVVSYLAYLVHIPKPYILTMAAIMLGIGVMSRVESARQQKDSNY